MNAPDATVPIRPAATVVLLRDGADGVEVWLQQRATTLVFAAGMYAFPGGAVDPADGGGDLPEEMVRGHAAAFGDVDLDEASAHIYAGIRETEEECGVILSPSALVPWSRWVTPVGSPRRFDARFYIARCPAGEDPRPLTGEVATGAWFVLASAVATHAAGGLPMWPPTIGTLLQLVPFDEVAAALAAAPERIEAVTE